MSPRTFLAVLFVLSGMAGLIHESIWSRYLGLFVGHGRLRSDHRRFLKQTAEGFLVLHDGRFGLCWMNGGHRVEPIPDFPVPAPTVPRLGDLSMSAALRRPPDGILPAEVDPRLPDAVQRKAQMQNVLTRGRAPTDWPAWLFEFAFAERDWHAGVLGVVDEDFYRLVGDFLDRGQAPPEARAAVTFLHDVASWRFPEASREADPLIASAAGGETGFPPPCCSTPPWQPSSRRAIGRGVRRAFDTLHSRTGWDSSDLRTRLLLTHLEAPASR